MIFWPFSISSVCVVLFSFLFLFFPFWLLSTLTHNQQNCKPAYISIKHASVSFHIIQILIFRMCMLMCMLMFMCVYVYLIFDKCHYWFEIKTEKAIKKIETKTEVHTIWHQTFVFSGYFLIKPSSCCVAVVTIAKWATWIDFYLFKFIWNELDVPPRHGAKSKLFHKQKSNNKLFLNHLPRNRSFWLKFLLLKSLYYFLFSIFPI